MAVARATAPEGSFDEEAFADFLAARPGCEPIHGGDLLLVYLCSLGDKAAQQRLDAEYLSQLPIVVAAVDANPVFVADVVQELKIKLYAERRLAQYGGRGALGAWLRRAALNTASAMLQPSRSPYPLDPMSESVAPDAELTFLKSRYRDDFRRAFVDALQSLSPRERTVLRLNSLSDVSIDELGHMYHVHRATAARWVQRARDAIAERTREALVARLRLNKEELDELLRLLRSQLDVSIRRYLEAEAEPSTGEPVREGRPPPANH